MSNFYSERHTLYCGWVLGVARKHNLPVRPVTSAEGNFTDRLVIDVSDDVSITLIVPEPPEDWSLFTGGPW